MLPISSRSRSGAALVETLFAVGVAAFSFASLSMMYSSALRSIGAQQETICATLALQERAEQIRATNWTVLTSGSRLQAGVFGNAPPTAVKLASVTEEVTINPYPPLAGVQTPLRVRREQDRAEIISEPLNNALLASSCVRVDLKVTWNSRGRARARESSMIVALGSAVR